jgi:hypothetical protein
MEPEQKQSLARRRWKTPFKAIEFDCLENKAVTSRFDDMGKQFTSNDNNAGAA